MLIPKSGTTLSGTTATLDASASNATSVEFWILGGSYGESGHLIGTAKPTLYGWVTSWNTTTVPNGSYVLLSEAVNGGSSGVSAGVTITVSNPLATSVLIPKSGTTLSGTTATLDASASNATSVEFWILGGSYGESGHLIGTAKPTLYGWVTSWNTTTVPNGSYVLLSEAVNGGSSGVSAGVTITVSNPLATSVLIPKSGTTLSGTTATLDASASNATSVEFWILGGSYGESGHLIGTAKPTLYGWVTSWNTTTVPNGSYVLLSEAVNGGSSGVSAGVTITVSNNQPASQLSQLLPGETTWSSGALSYEFGTNDTIDYGSPNVDTLPSVQAALSLGGLTLDRIWAYSGSPTSTPASIQQKIVAGKNAGMTCMFMLGQTDDLTWLESTVQLSEPLGCHIFEFGNEPDNGGSIQGTIANYTSQWISAIPVLRSMPQCETNGVPDINKCAFGGPAVTWSASNNTLTNSKYPDDISYFLGTAKAAGVLPDFVTYHDYPCQKATSEAQCISMTPGDFQWNYDTVLSDEQTQLGHSIPTGVTEYNFDPGTANLYNWAGDSAFMYQWTKTALDAIVSLHIPFANQFTSLNYSGYGDLDMFSDSAPYGPKPQFYGMVAEVEKYGGPSTLAIPNPLP